MQLTLNSTDDTTRIHEDIISEMSSRDESRCYAIVNIIFLQFHEFEGMEVPFYMTLLPPFSAGGGVGKNFKN